MKQTKLALSAVMIVAIGLTGANFVTGSEMTEQEKITAYGESSPIYGHVTVIHSDPDGNILNYIQTDNVVTAEGKNCMAEQVFGLAAATCTITATPFNSIGLFDGDSFLNTDTAASKVATLLTSASFAGLGITAGGVTETTPAAGGTNQVTAIDNTFNAGTGVSSKTVDGAGLYNSGGDALFAGQAFGSAVVLNDGDSLQVTWSITLGT